MKVKMKKKTGEPFLCLLRKALCLMLAVWLPMRFAEGEGLITRITIPRTTEPVEEDSTEEHSVLQVVFSQAAETMDEEEQPGETAETAEITVEPVTEIPEAASTIAPEPEATPEVTPEMTEPPASDTDISLNLVVKSKTVFTNVLFHYVYFDAEVRNAEKLTIHVLNPEGEQASFRTRKHVDNNIRPSFSAGYSLKKGQEIYENLNVFFPRDRAPGIWTIQVTATKGKKTSVTREIKVEVQEARPLQMNMLTQVHHMLTGVGAGEVVPVEAGKIRYICQDPKDSLFVRGYWFSAAHDLRAKAYQQCTRAVFSMALSWMGIDLTPVGMSDLMYSDDLFYTYDAVCEKLGTVRRVEGDLETLWARYQAGEASPVLVHFRYDGGMHAVLLAARDEEDPELFYAVTSSVQADTTNWLGGMENDMIIPILIEEGTEGKRIQSPLVSRYHRGTIDEIWQWEWTGEH